MKIRRIFELFSLFTLMGAQAAKQPKQPEANCEPDHAPFNPCKEFGFEVTAGMPSQSTTRWLIREHHNNRQASHRCVTALTHQLPGNKILYLESHDRGPLSHQLCAFSFNIPFTKTNTTCAGWDNARLAATFYNHDKETRFIAQLNALKIGHEERKATDSEWDQYYTLIALGLNKRPGIKDPDPAWTQEYCQKILSYRKNGLTYNEIFYSKELKYPRVEIDDRKLSILNKRDQSLVQSLREHPNDKKAILVAGLWHLRAEGYVVEELQKDKRKNNTGYAVLSPKR